MFEAFFIKIIDFKHTNKFDDITRSTMMGSLAKLQLLSYN